MKRIILQPEQIIVPYEYEVGNESILKIYFRIFDKGHGNDLPPIIVTKLDIGQNRNLIKRRYEEGSNDFYEELDKLQTNKEIYYLLDGNHKGIASVLCHNPIRALELGGDSDLEKLEKLVKSGEIFDIPNWTFLHYDHGRVNTKISSMVASFEEGHIGKMKDILTLKERVDKLTSNGDLPQYMKNRYLREK